MHTEAAGKHVPNMETTPHTAAYAVHVEGLKLILAFRRCSFATDFSEIVCRNKITGQPDFTDYAKVCGFDVSLPEPYSPVHAGN